MRKMKVGKNRSNEASFVTRGIVLGTIIGALIGFGVGAISGNWRVWVSFGASLGFAIGLIAGISLVGKADKP